MVKVILEKEDIVELIKAKYPTAEVEKGLVDDIQIYIKVKEVSFPEEKTKVPIVGHPPIVLDKDGNIDANESGLTLESRKVTNPGNEMGRKRGRLPTF